MATCKKCKIDSLTNDEWGTRMSSIEYKGKIYIEGN